MGKTEGWTKQSEGLWTNDFNPAIKVLIFKHKGKTRLASYPWKVELPNGQIVGRTSYQKAHKYAVNWMRKNTMSSLVKGFKSQPSKRKQKKYAKSRR